MPQQTRPAEASWAPWSLRDTGLCLLLLAAFLFSRILWIATNPESSGYWEEAYRWVAVEHLGGGAALPLMEYQADHYQGGSLVVIALAAALGAFGVDAFIALKIVALLFSGATLVALYLVGRVFFGPGVGFFCAATYLLGPPLVAFWGVVAMGFHAESALLSLCIVGVFLSLVAGVWAGSRAWFCLGLVSGTAIWFTPSAGVTVAACVLAWPWVADRPRMSALAIALVGLCVGLIPWLVYNVAHDFAGLNRILEVFGARSSWDPWRNEGLGARALDFFARAPTEGLLDPGGDHARPWPALALFAGVWVPGGLALAMAVVRALRMMRVGRAESDAETRREFVFLVYAVVFCAAYLASRFTLEVQASPIAYRLLVPLAVFLIPPIAVSTVRGLRKSGVRARYCAGACAIGFSSLLATTLSFALTHVETSTLRSQGQGLVVWGRLLHHKHNRDIRLAVDAAGRIAAGWDRAVLLNGIGWGLEYAYERGDLADLANSLHLLAEGDRAMVVKGLQWELDNRRTHLAADLRRGSDVDLRARLTHLEELSEWLAEQEWGGPVAERPPSSVVLVTLDTTRVDHLSCYGYERETTPKLDAFSARAVRFRHAWSTSSWTLPAHASLFTGLYPSRHGAHYDQTGNAVLGDVVNLPVARYVKAGRLADDVTTLAELLAARGYRTGAFVAGPWLHRSFGLLQGFEVKDDRAAGFGGRPADEITDSALEWLRGLEPDEPYLLFANYFDPHAPYEPARAFADLPRAGEAFEPPYDELMRGQATLDADQRAVLRDRYDAEIRVMDGELGRLLDEVMSRSGGERTLVVITADHGEALGEEGRFGHGFWLSEELIRIPMIVRRPYDRDAGSWNEEPVQLVDVLPLLATELGMPTPDGIEGVAVGDREVAFAELYHEATTAMRFGDQYAGDLRAAIRWPHKLLRVDDGRESLSLLSRRSLVEEEVADEASGAALAGELDQHLSERPARALVAPEVDQHTLEALRELGYLE